MKLAKFKLFSKRRLRKIKTIQKNEDYVKYIRIKNLQDLEDLDAFLCKVHDHDSILMNRKFCKMQTKKNFNALDIFMQRTRP